MIAPKSILLTIDVEDWFQVENFKPWIPFETWDHRELRVERNVHLLLDLFDSVQSAGKQKGRKAGRLEGEEAGDQEVEIGKGLESREAGKPVSLKASNLQPPTSNGRRPPSPAASELPSPPTSQQQTKCNSQLTKHNPQLTRNKSHAAAPASDKQQTTYNKPTKNSPKATFFVLGWLADRLPNLVREIQSRGHEIASHGYNHQRPDQLCAADLKTDLSDSKKLIEDITGASVSGYRAPSFAINDDILKIIEDCGYRYDSSYNSFGLHGRYGRISLNGAGKCGIAHKLSDNFYELPISNLRLGGQTLPWGGGGYFRLAPYRFFRRGVQSILENHGAYAFYLHPWEIDPDQPRVREASTNFKFRHYTNLNKARAKLKGLIEGFDHCQFITCNQYLSKFA